MKTTNSEISPGPVAIKPSPRAVPFGVNEIRLSLKQWIWVVAIVFIVAVGMPRVWKKVEAFHPGADYRIPYSLSKDYWLYERRLDQLSDPKQVIMLGDSVIWGEYVRPEGTLSHYLDVQASEPNRFINAGVNGLFPLAMEGLVHNYGGAIHKRKVIVHCNLLWMTSPRADLSTDKEESFNHSRLVPQFWPKIPCYKADENERWSAVIERNVQFFAWTNHLQNAYYDTKSIPQWTLEEEDGHEPPRYPHAWQNPLRPLYNGIPGEPMNDPLRGPTSPRHKPWNSDDGGEPTHFEWVDLAHSLQWQAFQRIVTELRDRDNEVLVIVGPFNEHFIAEDQRATFHVMQDGIAAWLSQHDIQHVVPEVLPSELYADASHPLTEGYAALANRLWKNEIFQKWIVKGTR